VQDVHGDGLQADLVALPQQRAAQLDGQGLEGAVAALGDGGVQELGGRVEAAEHVHEDLPVAGRGSVNDAPGVVHGGGQGQLTEHVLSGLKRPQDVLGVQRGGQAHVDQLDGGVVVDAGWVGGGGVAELLGEGLQLGRGAAEDHYLADLGMGVVDVGVGDPEAGAQQADLHGTLQGEPRSGGSADRHHRPGTRQPLRSGRH
jgi:hypothetical protein